MKHLTSYKLFEAHNIQTIIERWFNAIYSNDITEVKNIIRDGVDVNAIYYVNDWTGLMLAANYKYDLIVLYLLTIPEIDVLHKDVLDRNFIDIITSGRRYFLIDRRVQQKIIDNGRKDIIILLNDYGLLHEDILKEYPYLSAASDLNLI